MTSAAFDPLVSFNFTDLLPTFNLSSYLSVTAIVVYNALFSAFDYFL